MSGPEHPFLVDWPVTSRCNLSCSHCRGMPGGDLSTTRARSLITEIAALKPGWVIIEGGEPLLRHDLFELLELMRGNSLEVHLISNGMLLNTEVLTRLKQLGVRLMISIDGSTAQAYEAIRTGASFETVLRHARQAAEAGLLEAINATILKTNYTEIPGVMRLARDLGIRRVNLIGLKPCVDFRSKLPDAREYGEAIRLACQASEETGIEFFFDEPFFWATAGEWRLPARPPTLGAGILQASTSACIFGEYLFIEPSGEVKPCSFAPIVVGNVNESPLTEIWQGVVDSPFFKSIRQAGSRTGYCADCKHLTDCKGCRSRTYVLTGDWFATDPVCPLSLEPVEEKR